MRNWWCCDDGVNEVAVMGINYLVTLVPWEVDDGNCFGSLVVSTSAPNPFRVMLTSLLMFN
jgi:hypothetical protein